MKHIKGLDTLRAFAVMFVILDKFHWGPLFAEGSAAANFCDALIPDGRFGVTLFFVLSGFLISSILLNETFKGGPGSKMSIVKTFYLRRVFRIFPIYYLVVIIFLLLGNSFVLQNAGYFVFYCSNFLQHKPGNPLLHTWSLAVEEQFYLLWPWLLVFVERRYLKYLFAFCILFGVGFKYFEYYRLHGDGYLLFSCFDSFSLGGLYAYMRCDERQGRKFENGFIVSLVMLLFFAWRFDKLVGVPVVVIFQKFLESCVALGAIIFVLRNKNKVIQKYLLENRALIFIGKISYGLYLYHFFLGQPLGDFYIKTLQQVHASPILLQRGSVLLFKFAVLLVIAWTSFTFIEKPILAIKKRFAYAK